MPPTRPNNTRPAARPTSRHFHLSVPFIQAARRVPVRQRPTLLIWLHRYRRRHARTFHQLDPTTGRWHRP